MKYESSAIDYAEQIAFYARALTPLRSQDIDRIPVPEALREQMRLFVEENVDKRTDKLARQLELLEEAFDLPALLQAYGVQTPQVAYDNIGTDAERFLDWLEANQPLTAEQIDYIRCERARLAIEAIGRRRRADHVRFQELVSVAETLAEELADNPSLTLLLNPLRSWARFETKALLDDEDEPPVEVLFYARGADICTAALDDDARDRVRELETIEPCTLATWIAVSRDGDRDTLIELCRELAALGLVAFR